MTGTILGAPRPSSYPVRVEFDEQEPISRLWGIPILGHAIRWLILLPHWIVVAILTWLVGLSILVSWIPILLNGRPAAWMYDLIGGEYRWSTRVSAYALMLTDTYPPFSFDAPHPVRVEIDRDQRVNQLMGIPFIGLCARALILIPHFIALWFLGIGSVLVLLVSWIPVLLNGRMADWGYRILGGTLRWAIRVTLYFLMLNDVYPPFRLRD
ncbi:MAG TPA: DUF4389 domain-containing protein [Candidatus Limnocylindrales bacterium]|jgi:hypothetical protein|nr:DUF4389 domain-containing protein [Candidatus Limnocylindrales bacterium]